jgi:hypothetical protein
LLTGSDRLQLIYYGNDIENSLFLLQYNKGPYNQRRVPLIIVQVDAVIEIPIVSIFGRVRVKVVNLQKVVTETGMKRVVPNYEVIKGKSP